MMWSKSAVFFALLAICFLTSGVKSSIVDNQVFPAERYYTQNPPVPGESYWTANLTYITNSTARFGYFRQTIANKEWKSLGTSFTIEFWLKPKAFPSDPDGKWNDIFTQWGEPRFLPVLSRHPGGGHSTQWAHFWVQLVRTVHGLALNVYGGCGCEGEPQIVNGSQIGLNTCGYGYVLASDSPSITAAGRQPFYVPTESWTHIAFTFDGDSTEPYKTQQATLYINGDLLVTSDWGKNAAGARYNASTCLNKPLQWFRDFGMYSDIRLGFLQNQDFNAGRVVNNRDPFYNYYGFNCSFDEFKVWREPRTAAQIKANYKSILDDRQIAENCLVAYYRFNEGPVGSITQGQTLANSTLYELRFPSAKPNGPVGIVQANDKPLNFWSNSRGDKELGLVIDRRVVSVATLPSTPQSPQQPLPSPITTSFIFPGSSLEPVTPTLTPINATSYQPFGIAIWKMSAPLMQALQQGLITLTALNSSSFSGQKLIPYNDWTGYNGTSVVDSDTAIQVTVKCSDASCSNLLALGPRTPVTRFPYDWFAIYYQALPKSSLLATLYIDVVPHCDGNYDACGVCNGDNRTCQCVFYPSGNFKSVRMSYVLLEFMLDLLVDKLSVTSQMLDETIDRVEAALQTTQGPPNAAAQTQTIMTFHNNCLVKYCASITNFLKALGVN